MTSDGALPSALFQKAKEIHLQGNYPHASLLYNEILSAHPEFSEARHYLGLATYVLGESEKALTLIQETLDQEPPNAEWLTNFGNILIEEKRYADAGQVFSEVVSLMPASDQAWGNLGAAYHLQKQYTNAEEAYRKSLSLNPHSLHILKLLAALFGTQNRLAEAAIIQAEATLLDPAHRDSEFVLGKACLILDRIDLATTYFRGWLAKEPDNPVAAHFLAACTGTDVPEKCSKDFIEITFDNYAQTFDESQKALSYCAPEHLGELIEGLALQGHSLDVLDLGCGTGLCAPHLKPIARSITGVDLSHKMLERASQRSIYNCLVRADIIQYLDQHPSRFDLAASAEVLIYFGDLKELFTAVYRALRPRGYFLFTIEALYASQAPYKLHTVIRYCHTQAYVHGVIEASGFEVLAINHRVMRMEMCVPVEGFAWAVRKKI